MVFLLWMRYGSLSVDMSNQPNFALPDSTSRAQSLIRPLTRQTAAPWSAISLRLISGVSSGQKRSEEHTSELQSRLHLVCRLLLEKKKPHRSPIARHAQRAPSTYHVLPLKRPVD